MSRGPRGWYNTALVQDDTKKKRELLKNPTKIEEIQKKKNYRQKLNHYNLPFKRQ